MRNVLVRYKLHADRLGEHEALLAGVFQELAARKPDGLRYQAWKLADGVSFVHMAMISVAGNPLLELAAFKAFTADIASRCVEPPVATDGSIAGSYP